MHKDWERQKELVFEELGKRSAVGSDSAGTSAAGMSMTRASMSGRRSLGGRDGGFGDHSSPERQQQTAGSQLQMHTKMMKYDKITRRLNEQRKEGFAIGIVNAYAEASTSGSSANDSVRQFPYALSV